MENGPINYSLLSVSTIRVGAELLAQQPTCAICQSDFELDQNVARLPCQHIFHPASCLLPWLVRNRRPTCPCCRGPLGENLDPTLNNDLDDELPIGPMRWNPNSVFSGNDLLDLANDDLDAHRPFRWQPNSGGHRGRLFHRPFRSQPPPPLSFAGPGNDFTGSWDDMDDQLPTGPFRSQPPPVHQTAGSSPWSTREEGLNSAGPSRRRPSRLQPLPVVHPISGSSSRSAQEEGPSSAGPSRWQDLPVRSTAGSSSRSAQQEGLASAGPSRWQPLPVRPSAGSSSRSTRKEGPNSESRNELDRDEAFLDDDAESVGEESLLGSHFSYSYDSEDDDAIEPSDRGSVQGGGDDPADDPSSNRNLRELLSRHVADCPDCQERVTDFGEDELAEFFGLTSADEDHDTPAPDDGPDMTPPDHDALVPDQGDEPGIGPKTSTFESLWRHVSGCPGCQEAIADFGDAEIAEFFNLSP